MHVTAAVGIDGHRLADVLALGRVERRVGSVGRVPAAAAAGVMALMRSLTRIKQASEQRVWGPG